MALTQRQMACFEKNSQFLNEVAAALLPIAAEMKKQALVITSNPQSSETEQTFAATWGRIADQILAEQGVNLAALGVGSAQATGGSVGMKYLIQQMLMSPAWTLTPDQWATNEATARTTIQAAMAALLAELTAIPGAEQPQALAAMADTTKRGRK